MWTVFEDTPYNLTLSLRFNDSDYVCGERRDLTEAQLEVMVVLDEDWKLDLINSRVVFTAEEVCARVNKTVGFSGFYWGLTKMTFFLTRNDLDPDFNNTAILWDDLMITVDRRNKTLDTIFIYILSILVIINNIFLGSQLDVKIIKDVLRRPLGPLCGFLAQFTCMPLVTYGVVLALFSDPIERLGLFILGCCPGGVFSNLWTLIFDGDINLSVTMTAVSITAAMGMMPLWVFTLGQRLIGENTMLVIPFQTLLVTLVSLAIPTLIGLLIRWKKPSWATRCDQILRPFSTFVILLFISVGTYNSYKGAVMMTWRTVLAGVLMLGCGYTFGALLARLMCLPRKQIIAVSLETAIQNVPVAMFVLKLSLQTPYNDLASVPIITTFLLTGLPLFLAYLVYMLLQRLCGCCPGQEQTETLQAPQQFKDLRRTTEGVESTAEETSQILPM
nr:ileal sodium/bile acid cotransporter-like [Procambarus clarkii]